jgi:hypothetical protein
MAGGQAEGTRGEDNSIWRQMLTGRLAYHGLVRPPFRAHKSADPDRPIYPLKAEAGRMLVLQLTTADSDLHGAAGCTSWTVPRYDSVSIRCWSIAISPTLGQSLIDEAAREGVERVVFSSVPVSPVDQQVPTFRAKRQTEKALMASGVPYTILRCAPFMEVWLALPGSSIPMRDEENPTLNRAYPFCADFVRSRGGPWRIRDA